jgi:hypothetical protein
MEIGQDEIDKIPLFLRDCPAAIRAEMAEPTPIGSFFGGAVQTRQQRLPGGTKILQLSAYGRKPWKRTTKNSLAVLNGKNPFRLLCLWIVESRAFDGFILALILLNSVLIAITDYRTPDDYYSIYNDINSRAEIWLTVIFTMECGLKILGYGLIMENNAYLRDAWNWLDFIVVVSGLLSLALKELGAGDLAFLRVFRVLRPLRSLTVIEQMKVVVNTVLASIPQLVNVAMLALFLMLLFGILGINMFSGVMYRECRLIDQPNPLLTSLNDVKCWSFPLDPESDERLCGASYMCSTDGFQHGICKSAGFAAFPSLAKNASSDFAPPDRCMQLFCFMLKLFRTAGCKLECAGHRTRLISKRVSGLSFG